MFMASQNFPQRFGIQIRWTDAHKLRYSIHLWRSWKDRWRGEETVRKRQTRHCETINFLFLFSLFISHPHRPRSLTSAIIAAHHYIIFPTISVSIDREFCYLADSHSWVSERHVFSGAWSESLSLFLSLITRNLLSVNWLRNRAWKSWMFLF